MHKEKVIHGIVVFVLILPMIFLFPWLYYCPFPNPFVHKLDRQPPIFSPVLDLANVIEQKKRRSFHNVVLMVPCFYLDSFKFKKK